MEKRVTADSPLQDVFETGQDKVGGIDWMRELRIIIALKVSQEATYNYKMFDREATSKVSFFLVNGFG